jgi:ABC-type lipoprotein export system ATPase subunit
MHTLFSLKAICKEHKLGTTKVTALKNINLNLGQSQSYAVVGQVIFTALTGYDGQSQ